MKLSKYYFGVVGLLLCSALFFSSCEGGVGGNAPSSVAGKTMEIRWLDDGHLWGTIKFSSNTSAEITLWDGAYKYSSLEYKKTGSESATLRISGLDSKDYPGYPEDYNYSLIFASPNQGVANGRCTFTLF